MTLKRIGALAAGCAAMLLAGPAFAGRAIKIDTGFGYDTQACSAFTGCRSLNLQQGTFVYGVLISPTGFIELQDGVSGSNARFYIGDSAATYQIAIGKTTIAGQRTELINFYSPDVVIALNQFGNLPVPDFQISLGRVNNRNSQLNDLEIGFAYDDAFFRGGAHVAPGAEIGYDGTLRSANGLLAGAPLAPRSVTNDNGLLLGGHDGDSEFAFVVGQVLDLDRGTSVTALISQTFDPRYAEADAPVPEPATWAMMLFGFGATGMALRRRRERIAQPA